MSFRLLICLVALGLAIAPLADADETVTPGQKTAIEQIIHDYILEHPELVIQALQSAESKAKTVAEERVRATLVEKRKELLDDPTSPIAGNPSGDVTIVEFFDYRCPYCKQVEPSLEALLREDRQIRIVYKEIAASAGLDVDRVKADMKSPEIDDIIRRNFELAQALDIRGTPAFIIGGEMVPGAIDIATMKQKIAAARKAG